MMEGKGNLLHEYEVFDKPERMNKMLAAMGAANIGNQNTAQNLGIANAKCPSCTKFLGDWEHDPGCAWRLEQNRLMQNSIPRDDQREDQ